MAFKSQQHAFQEFQQQLQQLPALIVDQEISPVNLRTRVLQISQLFQQQILSFDWDGDDPNTDVQAIQIEINKQLRLLETDVIFLQAARHPSTTQQRQQQICDRLVILQRYCDAVLAIQPDSG